MYSFFWMCGSVHCYSEEEPRRTEQSQQAVLPSPPHRHSAKVLLLSRTPQTHESDQGPSEGKRADVFRRNANSHKTNLTEQTRTRRCVWFIVPQVSENSGCIFLLQQLFLHSGGDFLRRGGVCVFAKEPVQLLQLRSLKPVSDTQTRPVKEQRADLDEPPGGWPQ